MTVMMNIQLHHFGIGLLYSSRVSSHTCPIVLPGVKVAFPCTIRRTAQATMLTNTITITYRFQKSLTKSLICFPFFQHFEKGNSPPDHLDPQTASTQLPQNPACWFYRMPSQQSRESTTSPQR